MTQNSVVWWITLIAAILTALLNQTGLFPEDWYKYINLTSIIIGVIAAKLGSSPLPRAKYTQTQRKAVRTAAETIIANKEESKK